MSNQTVDTLKIDIDVELNKLNKNLKVVRERIKAFTKSAKEEYDKYGEAVRKASNNHLKANRKLAKEASTIASYMRWSLLIP